VTPTIQGIVCPGWDATASAFRLNLWFEPRVGVFRELVDMSDALFETFDQREVIVFVLRIHGEAEGCDQVPKHLGGDVIAAN